MATNSRYLDVFLMSSNCSTLVHNYKEAVGQVFPT